MREKQLIDEAIDRFSAAMRERMHAKRKQGWHGWDDCTPDIGERLLVNAADAAVTGNSVSCVDAADFAMMIWLQSNKKP